MLRLRCRGTTEPQPLSRPEIPARREVQWAFERGELEMRGTTAFGMDDRAIVSKRGRAGGGALPSQLCVPSDAARSEREVLSAEIQDSLRPPAAQRPDALRDGRRRQRDICIADDERSEAARHDRTA